MIDTLVDSDGDGVADQRFQYAYGDDGVRVSQTITEDTDHDGSFADETPVETKYLYDNQNPTGCAQILEEKDASGSVTKSYTLGHDIIAQQSPAVSGGDTLYLSKDGHGSTRVILDASGQIVVGQAYAYDAFGEEIGFDPATATSRRSATRARRSTRTG